MNKLINTIFILLIVASISILHGQGFCQEPGSSGETPFEDTIEALVDILREKGVISTDEADSFINRYRSGIPAKKEKGTVVTIIPEQKGREYIKEITDEVNKEITKEVTQTRDDLNFMTDELLTRSRLAEERIVELEKRLTEDIGTQLNKSSWTNRIRWGGDVRIRYQKDLFDEENYDQIYDPDENKIVNTTIDRARYRYRVRLEATAEIMKKNPNFNVGKVDSGVRIATGNTGDPVSTNDTLGDYLNKDTIVLDRAYLAWTYKPDYPKWGMIPQVTATAGRFANPWYSTDLVWDSDVNFEGMAINLETDTLLEHPFKAFITVGAFPLQELELYENDKWLIGGQMGFSYDKAMALSGKLAISYYDFRRTRGEFFNDPTGDFTNNTQPIFRQIGNALVDINTNPVNETYALAGDYKLLNITGHLDYDYWFPYHIIYSFDYVRNIGFDAAEVAQLMNFSTYPEETEGYQLGLLFGYPVPRSFGEWNASLSYKYLQADAVVDAFTDSDFHLSGTNARGWILKWDFGLSNRLWISGRWISSDEIRSVPISIDKFILDLNAKF